MFNIEEDTLTGISKLKVQPQRLEWAKELDNSDDLLCEGRTRHGKNGHAEC